MGNKRTAGELICEITDGVLSAALGVVYLLVVVSLVDAIERFSQTKYYTPVGWVIAAVISLCIGLYLIIIGIYIAAKGCADTNIGNVKIALTLVFALFSCFSLNVLSIVFSFLFFFIDLILLYIVPTAVRKNGKENPTVSAPSSVSEPLPVSSPAPVLESSVTAPAQTGIQKYIMCPICHDTFIKESEKCCDRCRLEYERLEAASVLRVVSAKGVYNGKEGYKLMDGKWQNVGIVALDNPDRYTVELDFFDSYKNTYERFYKKIILKDSENQSAFERKVNYYGSVKIDLIPDPSYTPKPPEHTAQTVHSDSTTTNAQKDYKEGNATVATGKSDPETWRSGMWGLGDEGMKQEYRKFLTKQGYKDTTVNAYVSAINKVKDFENTDWEGVYRNVKALCRDYDSYGPKAALGAQGHNTVISSLKQFHAFYYKNENKI